jgi:mutator protein MutT
MVRLPPPPQVCVGAIVVDGGELLLVRRARPPAEGTWSIPGGRVEPGETLEHAVLRELAEETGLEGACGPLVGWEEVVGTDHHFVILDFAVSVRERTEPLPGDDAADARWVPLGDVASHGLVDGLAGFLAEHGIIPPVS